MDNQNVFEKPENPIKHTKTDTVFSWLFFILSLFFVRSTLFAVEGLGAFLSATSIILCTLLYFSYKNVNIGVRGVLYSLFLIFLSSAFLTNSNSVSIFFTTWFTIALYMYFIYYISYMQKSNFLSDNTPFDVIKSIFILPLCQPLKIFSCAFSTGKGKSGKGKKTVYIFLGLLAAFIPTSIIIALLSSADQNFQDFIARIFSKDLLNIIKYIIFAVPCAMYIFCAVYSGAEKKEHKVLSEQTSEQIKSSLKFIPTTFSLSLLTPICIVYLLFFIVQAPYLFSGFGSVCPEGYTLSEYSRKGFFELCAASFINILIIIFISALTKREKSDVLYRIYTSVFSVFTIILACIAISKNILYIQSYGLTQLRLYSTCFIVLLALIFLCILFKQIFLRFRLFAGIFVAFALMFSFFTVCDTDGIIAKYNVWLYKTEQTESIDVYYLSSLSSSAVPYIKELTEIPSVASIKEQKICADATKILESKKRRLDSKEKEESVIDWFISLNIPRSIEKNILSKL